MRNISKSNITQMVYVPVRWEHQIDGNRDDSIENVEYYYSFVLKRNIFFKLRFNRKIRIILSDLESKINIKEVGFVHAHFLFSDGAVAYKMKKKYDTPYNVSVRATDLHYFFPLMPHLRKLGNQIMEEANNVIFINHAYKDIFKKRYLKLSFESILNKITVIPNAIHQRWFQTAVPEKKIKDGVRLLYVGRIIRRKKLDVLIQAIKEMNATSNEKYTLEIVGNGEFLSKIKKIANDSVIFHSEIRNAEQLKKIYNRCHIFIMPSVKETFGLVYIEALSQGLPIIHCINEGVSGYFKKREVSVEVLPNNTREIVDGVHFIQQHYEKMSSKAKLLSKTFNWDEVTNKYLATYPVNCLIED